MNKPKPNNTPIDGIRMRSWTNDFSGYRVNITENRIDRWLNQFDNVDRDLAARILDAVDYIGTDQISSSFRELLNSLPGWHIEEQKRSGKWFFIAFSGSGGESGDQMISRFRTANNLSSKKHNHMFPYKSELFKLGPSSNDTILLIDDFSGTGQQACDAWQSIFQELLPFGSKLYLMLIAMSTVAKDKIENETDMIPISQIRLRDRDNIFHSDCTYFSKRDKNKLIKYGSLADNKNPKGFGNSGFVIVFSHKCPNNSIPILHHRNSQWEGLFRRYD